MTQIIIDRIEGEFALCEAPDRTIQEVPLALLPSGSKPGDVLIVENEHYQVDQTATLDRAAKIKNKMDALWN